jgi:hypothetical protein
MYLLNALLSIRLAIVEVKLESEETNAETKLCEKQEVIDAVCLTPARTNIRGDCQMFQEY